LYYLDKKTTNLDKYSTWLSCSGEFFGIGPHQYATE